MRSEDKIQHATKHAFEHLRDGRIAQAAKELVMLPGVGISRAEQSVTGAFQIDRNSVSMTAALHMDSPTSWDQTASESFRFLPDESFVETLEKIIVARLSSTTLGSSDTSQETCQYERLPG